MAIEDNLSPNLLTNFSGNLTDLDDEDRETMSANPDKDIQSDREDVEVEVAASDALREEVDGLEVDD